MGRRRTIEIICGRCHLPKQVEQRQGYPRKYCDECDAIVKREQSAARMRKMRESRESSSGRRRQAKKPANETAGRVTPEFESFRSRILNPLHGRGLAMTL